MNQQHGLAMDEFLDHEARDGFSGERLGDWKKKGDGSVTLWLSVAAGVIAYPSWSHNFKRLAEFEDRETGDKRVVVYNAKFVCHEDEGILRSQHKRDDDGNRLKPPNVCPYCILSEFLRRAIREEKISWVEPVFQFDPGDPDKVVELRAGGICNLFGKKDLTTDEIRELKHARIRRDEAWKENGLSRLQYVFQVVRDDKPDEGVLVASESQILGEKMKAAIRQMQRRAAKARKSPDHGNPLKFPYAFEWLYHEEERFSDRYEVIALDEREVPKDIRKVIESKELPDLSAYLKPGNCRKLRAQMEEHSLVDLPWDEIFRPAEEAGLMRDDGEEDGTDFDPEKIERGAPEARGSEGGDGDRGADDPLQCDACEAPIGEKDEACGACGAEYDEVDGALQLARRPCPTDKVMVDVGAGENVICPKCATVIAPDWTIVSAPPKEEPKKASRRAASANGSGGNGKKPAAEKAPEKPAAKTAESRKRLDW